MKNKMVHREKNKVVEILFVEDDLSLLKHHLQNVYSDIHHIFLFTKKDFGRINELKKIISTWVDKISLFFIDGDSQPLDLINLSKLSDILKGMDYGFEDIICFSEIPEIPELNKFDEVIEHLKFEPVILRMTDFTFNLKKHCKNRHLGSLCVNFSFLLTNPNKVKQINDNKKVFFWRSFYFVDNGFNFSFFQNKDDILNNFGKKGIEVLSSDFDDIVSKNIHPKFFETEQSHYLSDYQENINFNTDFLQEQGEITSSSKKVLIIVNLKQKKVDINLLTEYFRVLNFNFTNDYSLAENQIIDGIENINIFIPKKPLYYVAPMEFFEKEFVLNELKKKLNQSHLIGSQILNLVIYIDEIELKNKIEISWEELKKTNLNQLLIEFFESDEHFQNLIVLDF